MIKLTSYILKMATKRPCLSSFNRYNRIRLLNTAYCLNCILSTFSEAVMKEETLWLDFEKKKSQNVFNKSL